MSTICIYRRRDQNMPNIQLPICRGFDLQALLLGLGAALALAGCGSGSTGNNTTQSTVAQPFTLSMLRPSSNNAVPNGSPVTFGAQCSGGTPPYTYSWNFGDGGSTQNSSTGASLVTHGYTANGSYLVTASCVDAGGAKAPSPGGVPIRAAIPAPTVRGFSTSLASVQAGSPVDFSVVCMSPYASSFSYQWNFGDGISQTTTIPTASHTYATGNTYLVSASCTDTTNNVTSRATLTVAVSVPQPTINAGLALGGAVAIDWPASFTVGCSGVGGGTWSYVWDFGDGGAQQTTSVPAATHTYKTAGNYTASVSCNNGSATPGTSSTSVVVGASAPSLTLRAGQPGGAGYADQQGGLARFNHPYGLGVDAAGNLYAADRSNNVIRKIKPDGTVSTLAGSTSGPGYFDGLGAAARFTSPAGVAADASGNVYVADGSFTVRKIAPDGNVSTLAGSGVKSYANGAGTKAKFWDPQGVAIDAAGNVYVTDYEVVRKITAAGDVSTIAGSAGVPGSTDGTATARFNSPTGIAVDAAGIVYVADTQNSTVRRIDTSGNVTTLAGKAGYVGVADGTGANARFNHPTLLSVDGSGNVFVADSGNHTLRKIASGGVVSTLAGTAGSASFADGSGAAARFDSPAGVAVDAQGTIYVADSLNHAIRATTPQGSVTTLAGGQVAHPGSSDGNGELAAFWLPQGAAVDASGNLYIADGNHTIRKITPARDVTTIAGKFGIAGATDGAATTQALFNGPSGIAADAAGNVYVADTLNGTVRKITTGGTVSTLAGTALNFGSSDSNGPSANFSRPTGVAVDAAGNVYVSDAGTNRTIRMIDPAGNVTTIAGVAGASGSADGSGAAARFVNPLGIAIDAAGNLYVTDVVGAGNSSIRKISVSGGVGSVTTLTNQLGNEGNGVALPGATGLAVDAAGTVYVAHFGASAIRKVTPAGIVSTVIGTPYQFGFVPGSVPGVLNRPSGVAIFGGTLYIVNTNENSIAEVGGIP
jgi:PKD repeat protein